MISQTLGEKLKKIREGEGLSIRSTALHLRIKDAFVVALESGRYDQLPGEVYIRNWLKGYATLFKISEKDLIDCYEHEKVKSRYSVVNCFLSPRHETKTPLTQQLRRLIFFIACFSIIGYLGYGVYSLVSAPPLEVYEPLDHVVSRSTTLHIRGKTSPHSKVLINNQEVATSPDGTFDEPIEVSYGLNELIVRASSTRGKTRVVRRTILVEKKDSVSTNLPLEGGNHYE